MKEVKDRNIVIVGGARSGAAAAVLLASKGATTFVTDSGAIAPQQKQMLEAAGVPFEENGHTERAKKADFVVVSPGVPNEAPLISYFDYNDIPVYSELEVACWYSKSRITAVTGSNGKTTSTSWLNHMWKQGGRAALMGGNIGTAVSELVDKTSKEADLILEVSSFQLDRIAGFRPFVSMILNITPDHLNRYQNKFENYVASKMRITKNQQPGDYMIYNYDDPVLKEQVSGIGIRPDGPQLLSFSMLDEVSRGAFIRGQEIVLRLDGTDEPLMGVEEVGLKGKHNLSNSLAVALAGRVNEISKETIRESLMTFEGVEHRLEQVRVLNGVRYINDSKATNVNAVWYALQSIKTPVVLIIGGQDKGNNYRELSDQIKKKVHTVIAIGQAKDAIRAQISRDALYYTEAETLEEAVKLSYKKAKKGETVLLSPACASFDMFESYEHRGKVFKQAVNAL
ncbi:MAG: UDP-N-acetylmuramoyl-L-alanine--D-glutamate ligase [Balneolia bacterium]|nr:UDP-N-acetylmuramoyl-L-alanine--D-glutamate ligase [Balneolia bacterium]